MGEDAAAAHPGPAGRLLRTRRRAGDPVLDVLLGVELQDQVPPAMLWMAPMSFCRASGCAEFARYAACTARCVMSHCTHP